MKQKHSDEMTAKRVINSPSRTFGFNASVEATRSCARPNNRSLIFSPQTKKKTPNWLISNKVKNSLARLRSIMNLFELNLHLLTTYNYAEAASSQL